MVTTAAELSLLNYCWGGEILSLYFFFKLRTKPTGTFKLFIIFNTPHLSVVYVEGKRFCNWLSILSKTKWITVTSASSTYF